MFNIKAIRLDFSSTIEWMYIFSLTSLFLKSFYFKFFWGIPDSIFFALSVTLWFIHTLITPPPPIQKNDGINFALLAFVIFFQIFSNKTEGLVGQVFLLFTMGGLITTSSELKTNLLKTIIYTYGIICLVSLIGWIAVNIFRIALPYSIVSFQLYRFFDYGLFNVCVEGMDFSRYLGMFIEPGYTGVMCVLLFIANGFNFKKKINIIILASALATLSLASYLLLTIYLLTKLCEKRSFKNAILGLVIVLFLLLIIHNFLYDLSWIQEYFFKRRLEEMLSGNITGNRFTNRFNIFFNNTILSDPFYFLFGLGSVSYNETSRMLKLGSAGYKVYIAQFGMFNTIFILLLYFRSICPKITYSRISIYVVWLLSFVDIAYPTWACFLIYIICFNSYTNDLEVETQRTYV